MGSIEVPPAEQRTFRVPLRPNASGTCLVRFRMAQLRSPAGVQQGSIDTRRLGAHFLAFDFTA